MRKAAIVVASLCFFSGFANAGTNGLDRTFGSGGILRIGPTPVSGIVLSGVRALHVQDDGKILVGGYVYAPPELPALGRLTADGQWDTTFADHGVFVLPDGAEAAPYGGRINALAVFSTGDVLAAGGAHSSDRFDYNGCTLLIKLTSVGALDSTFAPDKSGSYCFDFAPPSPGNYWTSHWDDLRVDDDGTFFLTAISTNLNRGAVAHFDSNGTLVNTYGTNGIAGLPDGFFSARVELLPGHRALVAGIVATDTSEGLGASIADLQGDVDLSYGTGGVGSLDVRDSTYYGLVYSAHDAQERLLLSSGSSTSGEDDSPYRLARFAAGGEGDASFNSNGQQAGSPGVAVLSLSATASYYDWITGAIPTADGHIVVVGSIGAVAAGDGVQNIALVRLNDDSSYDTGFGQSAHPGWASINVAGLDTSQASPTTLATDPASGRILVVIGATDGNGKGCAGLLRIVPDRLFDATFEPGTPIPDCSQ
jgi:uncharacterized delta-60 repeat protein